MPHLTVSAQHTAEAGFAGDVRSFVRQHRHDPRWRQLCKSWLVGEFENPLTFLDAQRMRARWP
jgi:hypothetical protein